MPICDLSSSKTVILVKTARSELLEILLFTFRSSKLLALDHRVERECDRHGDNRQDDVEQKSGSDVSIGVVLT